MMLHLPGKADAYLYPKTMFGPALVYTRADEDGRPVRLLRVGRSVQSATYVDEDSRFEPVFDYYLAFDLMFEVNPRIQNVLMLGGGGYAYPKHLIATRPEARIDVVEIDPAITSIARRHFFLGELIEEYGLAGADECDGQVGEGAGDVPAGEDTGGDRHSDVLAGGGTACDERLNVRSSMTRIVGAPAGEGRGGDVRSLTPAGRLGLICADGAEYLRERAARAARGDAIRPCPYDAIVFDTFAGRRPVESLASLEAIRHARACLSPDGVLVANVVAALEGPKSAFLNAYLERLQQVFRYVQAVPLSPDAQTQPDNVIVLASDKEFDL